MNKMTHATKTENNKNQKNGIKFTSYIIIISFPSFVDIQGFERGSNLKRAASPTRCWSSRSWDQYPRRSKSECKNSLKKLLPPGGVSELLNPYIYG